MHVASVAIIPAAGRSERFGSMKLLAEVDGAPLLDRTLATLLDAGVDRVVVVLAPAASFDAVARLRDPRVEIVVNPDPSRGMFSSIQTGLATAAGTTMLILPADMPFVRSATAAAVLAEAARVDGVVLPLFERRRGHPIALPGRLRRELLEMNADQSLKDALVSLGEVPHEIAVDDPGVLRDVDVREDLPTPS